MNKIIELPVVVKSKDDLQEIFQSRFRMVVDAFTVDNQMYPDMSLVFLGFVGSQKEDGFYHGVYNFREAQPKDCERDILRLSDLPDCEKYLVTDNQNKKTKTKKTKASGGK